MAIKAWMRVLRITLTTKSPGQGGKNRQMVIEDNGDGIGLAISVTGNKYMSTLKDCCTVKIANLTYAEIIQIISGQFYNIKIECGYKSSGVYTIFDGGVMYVSNLRESVDTNIVTILCASHLVSTWGQKRLNLSFNSGINLYSAINFVCKTGAVQNPNISTQFKKQFFNAIENTNNKTAAEWINEQTIKKGSYITSSDCVGNSFLTMFDAAKSNARVIKLDNETLILTGGFPKLTTEGLIFSAMPTFAFQCGDVIEMDNSLIQLNINSQQTATKNLGGLLDENGQYMIYEIYYALENRGNNFYLEISAKTRSKISAYLAKESN